MKKRVLSVSLVSILVIFTGCFSDSQTKKSVENNEKSEEVAHGNKDEDHLDYHNQDDLHLYYDNQEEWEFTAGQV